VDDERAEAGIPPTSYWKNAEFTYHRLFLTQVNGWWRFALTTGILLTFVLLLLVGVSGN